jgi:glycosyltransferase involved in cell wall biosynthesis
LKQVQRLGFLDLERFHAHSPDPFDIIERRSLLRGAREPRADVQRPEMAFDETHPHAAQAAPGNKSQCQHGCSSALACGWRRSFVPRPHDSCATRHRTKKVLQTMSYQLGLLSEIHLVRRDGAYWSLDLWVKDLEAQVGVIDALTLFSPIVDAPPASWGAILPLPACVRVVDLASREQELGDAVATVDVVQIPGNQTWFGARRSRQFLRLARKHGKRAVLGVSSDRARTQVLNATGAWPNKVRARIRFVGVRANQAYLAARSDGVFVVGEGLRRSLERWNRNVHVGTASWIRADVAANPVQPRQRGDAVVLCAAARLEPMKGIHLAVGALARLRRSADPVDARLGIAGVGPERERLQILAEQHALSDRIRFVGSLAYPEPFFALLRDSDIVLFTNLNDEQPRLIFDAISQGCLIVCPATLPYRALGIPEELLYERGDEGALARRIRDVCGMLDDDSLRQRLNFLAQGATIEGMHARRSEWIRSSLLAVGAYS